MRDAPLARRFEWAIAPRIEVLRDLIEVFFFSGLLEQQIEIHSLELFDPHQKRHRSFANAHDTLNDPEPTVVDIRPCKDRNPRGNQLRQPLRQQRSGLEIVAVPVNHDKAFYSFCRDHLEICFVLDFKSYLKFDMKEIRDDGSVTSLRRGLAAGSGSEQALPYYVVLAASLASKMKTDRSDLSGHTLRSVLIDEAFANVDDEKACNMIKMLQGMGLQPILVIPDSERINRFCMLTGSAFYHQRIGNERFEVALFGEDEDFYE